MVDTEQENTVAAKSILKRRVRNERAAAAAEEAATATAEPDVANSCKRFVTFDDTITVKNDKDLVVKKPLKLELIIDHWKSSGGGGAKAASDWAVRPDSGVVKRLVNEFNAVQDKTAASLSNRKLTIFDRLQKRGRVSDLVNMFNSKSTDSNKTEVPENKSIDF